MYKLYHITPDENVSSILQNGLITSIGDRTKRCKYEKGNDKRISMCLHEDLKNWVKALFNKTEFNGLSVFEIDINGLSGLKRRQWSNGYEYASWDNIPTKRLKLLTKNDLNI